MPEIAIKSQDAGRSFTLNPGDGLVIELEENLSTGYSWEVRESPGGILRLAGAEHEEAARTALGATGTKRFRFAATSQGSGRIELVLRRPWDPPDRVAQSFAAQIEVR